MENDWRLKQLMNTYTEMSGRTHVCSGQLLSELGRGTSEGVVQVHSLFPLRWINNFLAF